MKKQIPIHPATLDERLPPLPEGALSIVVIPDTQAYRGGGTSFSLESADPISNPVFAAQVEWICQNLESHQIAFVSHVGDMVDCDVPAQWAVAQSLMDRLHGKVPYGFSLGNKDYLNAAGDSTGFQRTFPASRFADCDWYGGCFPGSPFGPQISGNNANSFQLFQAGELNFVFLHLECNAPDDVLVWANAILPRFRDRIALITCHMGWGPRYLPLPPEEYFSGEKGRMTWSKIHGDRGNSPQQIWEKCYRLHPHLFAIFSGDQVRTQAIRGVSSGEQGNLVHELMQDYATGWLRLLHFIPAQGRVDVYTFNPETEVLCQGTTLVPDRGEHQFVLPFTGFQTAREVRPDRKTSGGEGFLDSTEIRLLRPTE